MKKCKCDKDFETLAKYYYSLFESDDLYVDDALKLLVNKRLIDPETHEWIEEDET